MAGWEYKKACEIKTVLGFVQYPDSLVKGGKDTFGCREYEMFFKDWQPESNIAQAMELLGNYHWNLSYSGGKVYCFLFTNDATNNLIAKSDGNTPAEAIVNAILEEI